ncbi:MAG: SDR family oxidoreductase [Parvularculaceae bacterium]|nr:SDR family oxidoreductase [Parvularculaceae bacterium]
MRVLVLGGYGFIGAEISRALIDAGREVVGLGRDAAFGRRIIPEATWIGSDIGALTTPAAWAPHLRNVAAVVNAAGALQDGARDSLQGVHESGIAALIEAAEAAGVSRFIQISAPGARFDASTAFLRTKAAGDASLRASRLDWVIFKPGLVIGRNAYGGTALLRLLAGLPGVEALALADAKAQTVSIDDVTDAVTRAVAGGVPMRADYDLVEDRAHALGEIVAAMRRWLGFREPVLRLRLPRWAAAPVIFIADVAGALGWRSPLRSTAMTVMAAGVVGDPAPWRAVIGRPLNSLEATLRAMPATAQERLYARAQLALPVMLLALGLFWLVSGAMGLVRLGAASAHLVPLAGEAAAKALVGAASLLDMAIGAGVLVRRTARAAALLSIVVAFGYLMAGTIIEPALWLDPLGVYVKIIPAMALAAATALLIGER